MNKYTSNNMLFLVGLLMVAALFFWGVNGNVPTASGAGTGACGSTGSESYANSTVDNITCFDNGTYVTYNLPYMHTHPDGAITCIVSNFGTASDNVTRVLFTVMSNFAGGTDRTSIGTSNINTSTAFQKSVRITFNGQGMYIGTSTDNLASSLSSYVGTSEAYGAKLTFISSIKMSDGTSSYTDLYGTTRQASVRDSHLNCKNIVMSCYQGTTSPARVLTGYNCEAGYVMGNNNIAGLRPYDIDPWAFGWINEIKYTLENNPIYMDNATGYTY
ncbi:hypothetical protein [Candidatus Magnetomonas plexicatena]|uniref:hypothetical protein n=1 Tax=Candidatus Magnetomonas plexicatena TaxID=2552947 RepID=UPI001102425A|nr:hypothetical protein E2O03_012455 [Nitrospirales bacterium LBB_01]